MGIFNFVREAGSKIGLGEKSSEADAEAARDEQLHELREGNKLLKLILDTGLDIEKPKVKYDDGVATVTGTAGSQQVRETIVLMIGNCAGVAAVDDQMEVDDDTPESVFYTVKSGDTLGAIAKEHLGAANRYMEIFEANQPMLKDPNLIHVGQVLRIPQD